jgi:hypothetical protein
MVGFRKFNISPKRLFAQTSAPADAVDVPNEFKVPFKFLPIKKVFHGVASGDG